MSRLRVAYVAHSVDPARGGMELVSARLLERLAPHVDLEVVAGDGLGTLPPGVRRTWVPIPRGPSIARLLAFDALASARLVTVRRRVDLVHTCGAVAHTDADLLTMHLSHAATIEAQGGARPPGRAGAHGAVAGVRRRLAARLEARALRGGRTRLVAAVSKSDAAELAVRYPSVDVAVVENGIDLERFQGPARDADVRVPLRVVVVAGDFERKGVPLAVRAVARTSRCTLRVVGEGDRRSMRLLAGDLGASERIEFVPHRADVEREFAFADVVLSCSLHESFGLATVEGAAAGCAVVCTPTGVGPELVEDDGGGPGGLVVPPNEFRIARALDDLDLDRERCRAMGAAAARRAATFSWDAMAAATLSLYDELIGRRP